MNLLVTGAWSTAKENIAKIESMGCHVVFQQQEKEKLPCSYEWVEGVICNGLFLSHPIERFINLRYIQLTSAGFDRIPMEYVREHQIEIHNARGVYSIPMAEFAVAGILQIYKGMRGFTENQRQHSWEKNRSLLELSGKNVCIIGCGSVGTECAKRFQAFGCNVVGVALVPGKDRNYNEIVLLCSLEKILPVADIVVLTVPLTEGTRHFMNAERFAVMKRDAIIVNIARGGVVDTDALLAALPKLGGAVLDVFEEEPLDASSPLWDLENVVITPHNAFVGEHNQERLAEVIIGNLSASGR